jgi:hypothetical protein
MCLYPMMAERVRPWMTDSSNQPDQPIVLLLRSRAPLSPTPTQSLLHLSIILSINLHILLHHSYIYIYIL